MNDTISKINYLDCTFRDGGYYNNWNFKRKLINYYIKTLSYSPIEYVEIGFRTFNDNIALGETAFSSEKFINSLKLNESLKYGVMVNASDLFVKNKIINNYKKLFPKKNKIEFVRLACHEDEIFKIKDVVKFLKKNGYTVFVNLMQISEIKNKDIKKISVFLEKTQTDVFYIADSFGSLNPNKTKKIIFEIKKFWTKDIGIHAHDNLGLAYKNSLAAISAGASWVDSTVLGMGRGPGNTKTEDIFKKFKNINQNKKSLKKIIKDYFHDLKKKYKWGKSIYYSISAKNKIHPTFVQKILSDERIKKKEKLIALNFLKKIPSKKFDPFLIENFIKFNTNQNTKKLRFLPKDTFKNFKIVIIGGGNITKSQTKKLFKLARNKEYILMSINLNKKIPNKMIDLFIFSHPLQIQSQLNLLKNTNNKIVCPSSFLSKKFKQIILNKKNTNFFNYDLSILAGGKIIIKENECILPEPLGIGYAISLSAAKKASEILIAGVDKQKNKDTFDNSSLILNKMKKKIKNIPIKFL